MRCCELRWSSSALHLQRGYRNLMSLLVLGYIVLCLNVSVLSLFLFIYSFFFCLRTSFCSFKSNLIRLLLWQINQTGRPFDAVERISEVWTKHRINLDMISLGELTRGTCILDDNGSTSKSQKHNSRCIISTFPEPTVCTCTVWDYCLQCKSGL